MHKYAHAIFKENVTLWIPGIMTISFLSCLIALCLMHLSWVSQSSFIAHALEYDLDLSEFKIISTTLYLIVLTLSFISLWLIGKATTQQLRVQFAQWRILGATPKETIKCSLFFSLYISAIGGISGTAFACPLSFWVLPKLNMMANGYQEYMVFEYHLSLAAIIGAVLLSFSTCLVSSGLSAFLARQINPLDIFRSGSVNHFRYGRVRKILGWCCLVYTILLIGTLPAIKQLNGGISSVYNLMLHIGASGLICVFIFAPTLLSFTKKIFIYLTEKTNLRIGRISVFAVYHKIEKNNTALIVLTAAFTLLTIMYLGIKVIAIAAFEISGIKSVNLSDSFAIAFLLAIVAVFTAFSIIILNFKNERAEWAVMRSNGLSISQSKRLVLHEAFVFTGTTLLLSVFPVLMVSLVGSFGLLLIGIPHIIIDLWPYVLGFIVIVSFLSVVLWVPTHKRLKGQWIKAMKSRYY